MRKRIPRYKVPLCRRHKKPKDTPKVIWENKKSYEKRFLGETFVMHWKYNYEVKDNDTPFVTYVAIG